MAVTLSPQLIGMVPGMKIGRRMLAMKLCWIALAIFAIALSIRGATRAAAETDEFPVSWSPRLEVELPDLTG